MSEYYNARSENGLGKESSEDELLKCPKCNYKKLKKSDPFQKRCKDGFPPVPPEPAKYGSAHQTCRM